MRIQRIQHYAYEGPPFPMSRYCRPLAAQAHLSTTDQAAVTCKACLDKLARFPVAYGVRATRAPCGRQPSGTIPFRFALGATVTYAGRSWRVVARRWTEDLAGTRAHVRLGAPDGPLARQMGRQMGQRWVDEGAVGAGAEAD